MNLYYNVTLFLEVKTFEGALVHVITFRNLAQPRNEMVALQTDIQVFSVTGYQQWREQNPCAVNLILLLPLKNFTCSTSSCRMSN